ncbi:MAG: malto-oligosyltrehalose synthase [Nitrososphaerota archaeon]|jgi:(1->4)-alpha-D-glucan 1-alpha-D-glucosylmutase|nr:malto-oligosyltrehalose synthase [Nitrososphaerota archaeon]MDG6918667.1 malto-oligosyltrehalose synthase [Nitrososphaerota archaeon]MDG6946712.1 malto-oligosyltrehalose synthase [Nitrososphaerota archaeon]
MKTPGSTYRLQLNCGFPFSEAERLVPYLSSLGVQTLYCSPVLKAKTGSAHCYDVTDHSVVNHELGGAAGLASLSARLKERGMGLLLDIVPNHMSASHENPYWMDVLEKGEGSQFSRMFDIDWDPPDRSLKGKVLLPVLGCSLREAESNGSIQIAVGGISPFSLLVDGSPLPISRESYAEVVEALESVDLHASLRHAVSRLKALLQSPSPHKPRESPSARRALKARLASAIRKNVALSRAGARGFRVPTDHLARVLSKQHYVLSKWTEAGTRINYRRFLNVNELVALRVEDLAVFERTHGLVASLLRSGEAMGVRVDHADGLRDPAAYFRRLSAATGGAYTLAEKILMTGRRLPKEWEVSGTTGYDFLNAMNLVLVDEAKEGEVDAVYRRFTGDSDGYLSDVRAGKLLAMETMRSESGRLARLLLASAAQGADKDVIEEAIRGVASNLDGYRTYTSPRTRVVRGAARRRISRAAVMAVKDGVPRWAVMKVRDALLLKGPETVGAEGRAAALEFVLRFQQFTAAVAVKGEEDTALYRFVRLASLNEVGGDPSTFGTGPKGFHRKCRDRARDWPGTMNATSTHDTKRSEDVRARISVLSEIPDRWEEAIERWHSLSAPARGEFRGRPAPTPRDEYLFYQTLVGAWPPDGCEAPALARRLVDYMTKAVREEREQTSWARPSRGYEERLERFILGVLRKGSTFLDDFLEFEREVEWYGALNSLTQALVKITAPGVPDVYQGNESLDYSLVDPDNRRPVDFGARRRMLESIDSAISRRGLEKTAQEAALMLRMGTAKMYVTALALRYRRGNAQLFATGGYVPVKGTGPRARNLLAFVRRGRRSECVVCAPRLFTELCAPGALPCGGQTWQGTGLVLPGRGPRSYEDVFTGRVVAPAESGRGRLLRAAEVFSEFPVALLSAVEPPARA